MVWITEFKAQKGHDKEFLKMVSDIERIDNTLKVLTLISGNLLFVIIKSDSKKQAWERALWFRDRLKEKGLVCPHFVVMYERPRRKGVHPPRRGRRRRGVPPPRPRRRFKTL